MKAEAKRQNILQAAQQCFRRYGYDKTTLDDIGRVAGLNKATLYYYFKNKEEIFLQIVLAESTQHITRLQAEMQRIETAANKIKTYLRARLAYYDEVLQLHQLSPDNLRRLGPQFDALYTDMQQREQAFLAEILEGGIAQGELQPHDTRQIAGVMLQITDALKHAHYYQWQLDSSASTPEATVSLAIQLIINGLKQQ